MKDSRIKELREKFNKECCESDRIHWRKVRMSPDETFQWFVDNVIKAKEKEEPKCKHEWIKITDGLGKCCNCGKYEYSVNHH